MGGLTTMTKPKKPPVDLVLNELRDLCPKLTEKEWEARDAEVAEIRALADVRSRLDTAEGQRRAQVAMVDRGWPERAVDDAFNADVHREAITAMRDRDPRRNIIVLSGSVGSGKTVAAARWSIDEHRESSFVRATTMARTSRYESDSVAPWYNARALVLDDLGAEYLDTKGSYLVDLAELIDTYHGERRPLVITTNCRWGEFEARYQARITDRLHESAEWISLSSNSMRSGR
jgi:DNA replication protein DnaC